VHPAKYLRKAYQPRQFLAQVGAVLRHDMVNLLSHRRARPTELLGLGFERVTDLEFSQHSIHVEPSFSACLSKRHIAPAAEVDPKTLKDQSAAHAVRHELTNCLICIEYCHGPRSSLIQDFEY